MDIEFHSDVHSKVHSKSERNDIDKKGDGIFLFPSGKGAKEADPPDAESFLYFPFVPIQDINGVHVSSNYN